MKVIIMAGGKGTRFWPRSTEAKPKQFLNLDSEKSLLQETYDRFAAWFAPESIYVVTARQYVDMVQEQLPHMAADRLIVEPEQRDTGPCAALTALHFLNRDDDEVMVFAPSDHHIPDADGLRQALAKAERAASEEGAVATLGIVPTRPETGYGYMETKDEERDGCLDVLRFIEKPSEETAKALLAQPNIYWNSGIFIWKPSTIAHYMKKHEPGIWEPLERAGGNRRAIDVVYPVLPNISVDYAILEKAESIRMVPVRFEWDDVGTWTALERIRIVDEHGNIAQGDVHAHLTANSIVLAQNKKALVIGAENLIIVSTEEGLLVCHKSKEQEIKKALQAMQDNDKRKQGGG